MSKNCDSPIERDFCGAIPEQPPDNLSEVHFKAVRYEIEGRFFSKEEANDLKAAIDWHTIADPQTRVLAAKAWE